MANLYGVANAPNQAYSGIDIPSNVSCPANVWTLLYTSGPIVAPSNGYFFPAVWSTLVVSSGAVVNSGMNLGLQIGAGTINSICGIGGQALIANTAQYISFSGNGPASQVAWQGLGSTISLYFQPGNQLTVVYGVSPLFIMLMRAPDQ